MTKSDWRGLFFRAGIFTLRKRFRPSRTFRCEVNVHHALIFHKRNEEVTRMCDYSLHGLPNRLAQEGEDLVAHRFPTGAIGLTAPAELERRATLAQTRCEKKSFWSMLKAAL